MFLCIECKLYFQTDQLFLEHLQKISHDTKTTKNKVLYKKFMRFQCPTHEFEWYNFTQSEEIEICQKCGKVKFF